MMKLIAFINGESIHTNKNGNSMYVYVVVSMILLNFKYVLYSGNHGIQEKTHFCFVFLLSHSHTVNANVKNRILHNVYFFYVHVGYSIE